jgi:hypothetical protein
VQPKFRLYVEQMTTRHHKKEFAEKNNQVLNLKKKDKVILDLSPAGSGKTYKLASVCIELYNDDIVIVALHSKLAIIEFFNLLVARGVSSDHITVIDRSNSHCVEFQKGVIFIMHHIYLVSKGDLTTIYHKVFDQIKELADQHKPPILLIDEFETFCESKCYECLWVQNTGKKKSIPNTPLVIKNACSTESDWEFIEKNIYKIYYDKANMVVKLFKQEDIGTDVDNERNNINLRCDILETKTKGPLTVDLINRKSVQTINKEYGVSTIVAEKIYHSTESFFEHTNIINKDTLQTGRITKLNIVNFEFLKKIVEYSKKVYMSTATISNVMVSRLKTAIPNIKINIEKNTRSSSIIKKLVILLVDDELDLCDAVQLLQQNMLLFGGNKSKVTKTYEDYCGDILTLNFRGDSDVKLFKEGSTAELIDLQIKNGLTGNSKNTILMSYIGSNLTRGLNLGHISVCFLNVSRADGSYNDIPFNDFNTSHEPSFKLEKQQSQITQAATRILRDHTSNNCKVIVFNIGTKGFKDSQKRV